LLLILKYVCNLFQDFDEQEESTSGISVDVRQWTPSALMAQVLTAGSLPLLVIRYEMPSSLLTR